jgi:hypothetical protein
VPLDIAVNFVVELEGRIDEQRKPSIQTLDTSLCCHATPVGCNHEITNDPDTWAETMRAEAMKIGFKKLEDTENAAVRVHAHFSGQDSDYELEHIPFSQWWKP